MADEAQQLKWDCYNAQYDEVELRKLIQNAGFTPAQSMRLAAAIAQGYFPSPYCTALDNGEFKTPHTVGQILAGELKVQGSKRHLTLVE